MSLSVNDSIQNNSPKPLDNKYGIFTSGAFRPYVSVTEANTTIAAAYRTVGLTVLINTTGGNVEYWYQTGIANGNLVVKSPSASVDSPIIIDGGGNISIQQATSAQSGYLSNTDWNTFTGKLSGVMSGGTGQTLYIGSSAGVVSLKGLVAGTGITLSSNSTDVTITAQTVAATNLGSGAAIYASNSGLNLQLRSIVAGTGVSVAQGSNAITISSSNSGFTGPVTVTTTTAIPTTVTSVAIPDTSVGVLQVLIIALITGSASNCTTALRYVQYSRQGGIITLLGPVGDIMPEVLSGSLTTTSWTISIDGSNASLDVVVTGQASTNIEWNAYTNLIPNT